MNQTTNCRQPNLLIAFGGRRHGNLRADFLELRRRVSLRGAGRADLELPAVLLFQSAQSHRFGVYSRHELDHPAAERGADERSRGVKEIPQGLHYC